MSSPVPATSDLPPAPQNPTEAAPVSIEDEGADPKPNKKEKLTPPEGGWKEFPSEFDPSKHAPPRLKEFADPIIYLEWRIKQNEEENKRLQQRIDTIRQFGSDPEAIKKAKQFNSSLDKLTKLIPDLPEGVDVQALLGTLLQRVDEKKKG